MIFSEIKLFKGSKIENPTKVRVVTESNLAKINRHLLAQIWHLRNLTIKLLKRHIKIFKRKDHNKTLKTIIELI